MSGNEFRGGTVSWKGARKIRRGLPGLWSICGDAKARLVGVRCFADWLADWLRNGNETACGAPTTC